MRKVSVLVEACLRIKPKNQSEIKKSNLCANSIQFLKVSLEVRWAKKVVPVNKPMQPLREVAL